MGEIDGNPVGICHIGGGAVVFHRLQQSIRQGLPLPVVQILGQVDQIHVVDAAGLGKLPGVPPSVGQGLILLAGNQLAGAAGELLQRRGDGGLQLRQVHHRQGGQLPGTLLGAYVHKVVGDLLSQLDCGYRGIFSQLCKPVGVVPAHPRLRLLRGNQIVGVPGEHQGVFRCGHQTGVKADEIEVHVGVFQGGVNFGQPHRAAGGEFFVVAVAADGAAAVVPENESVPAGGEFSGAVGDEAAENLRVRHGDAPQVLFQTVQLSVFDLPDLICAAADLVAVPAGTAAGIDQQTDFVRSELSRQHLLQIGSSHTAAGLQVRAAHIDHDGNGILSAAPQLGPLGPGGGVHLGVQPPGVGLSPPAAGYAPPSQTAHQCA